MATAVPLPTIADRADIHKSCKTLEVVVNILNDYCEAANAIVLLQKKLAKALREVAVNRCIGEVPANALNASATIFDTLVEVDSKFSKIADKECDSVSADVKKWFKKLAKEERAHDERIAVANAKIKQAGEIYEKKSKKNPQGAGEEHTRYINLLSTLGPEVNQEKYTHALNVTQRHSTIVYGLAACLSRVADSEWMRACEGVRRVSPAVGQLGEWRALCEGGWSGPTPSDLPDPYPEPPAQDVRGGIKQVTKSNQELTVPSTDRPAPEYSSRDASEQEQGSSSRAATPSRYSPIPPPQYLDTSGESRAENLGSKGLAKNPVHKDSDASLTSLTAFPSPPTHFPLPPLNPDKSSDSNSSQPTSRPLPIPGGVTTPALSEDRTSPATSRMEVTTPLVSSPQMMDAELQQDEKTASLQSPPVSAEAGNVTPSSSVGLLAPSRKTSGSYSRDDGMYDAEFGVRRSLDRGPSSPSGRTDSSKPLERSNTNRSNRSTVAALRDRYAHPAEPQAPSSPSPRRDVPRMAASVSTLAGKYDRPGAVSPTEERRRRSLDSAARSLQDRNNGSSPKYGAGGPTDDVDLRRHRIEELEELELREQEYELRMREREIDLKAREVERDRLRLLSARGGGADGYASDSSRGTAARAAQRPPGAPVPSASRYPLYSYSTTQLVPSMSAQSLSSHPTSQSASPAFPSRPADHASYCGCDACSASKYRTKDAVLTPRDLRPPTTPISLRPEKPKGWIRRLSMPVMGNAFGSDTKKSPAGIAGGPGLRSSLVSLREDGRDMVGGRSSTNLSRR